MKPEGGWENSQICHHLAINKVDPETAELVATVWTEASLVEDYVLNLEFCNLL